MGPRRRHPGTASPSSRTRRASTPRSPTRRTPAGWRPPQGASRSAFRAPRRPSTRPGGARRRARGERVSPPAPAAGSSIERLGGALGSGQDNAGDNAADFAARLVPEPQNFPLRRPRPADRWRPRPDRHGADATGRTPAPTPASSVIAIGDARALPDGATATVEGVALVGLPRRRRLRGRCQRRARGARHRRRVSSAVPSPSHRRDRRPVLAAHASRRRSGRHHPRRFGSDADHDDDGRHRRGVEGGSSGSTASLRPHVRHRLRRRRRERRDALSSTGDHRRACAGERADRPRRIAGQRDSSARDRRLPRHAARRRRRHLDDAARHACAERERAAEETPMASCPAIPPA